MVTDRLSPFGTHQDKGDPAYVRRGKYRKQCCERCRARSGCAMRSGRRGSRPPTAPASWSTCATPKWRGWKFSTRRSIRCSRKFPTEIDLFDRGISQGDTPRLWIDVVAHVMMGRDKRIYRFVQDTRFGRIVIAESHEVAKIVEAVTDYVARRMIEREHALVATPAPAPVATGKRAPRRVLDFRARLRRRRAGAVRTGAVRDLAQSLDQPRLPQLPNAQRIVDTPHGLLALATPRRRARSKTDYRPRPDSGHARSPTPTARRPRGSCPSVRRSRSSNARGHGRAGPVRRRAASERASSSAESVSRLMRAVRAQRMMDQQHAKRLGGKPRQHPLELRRAGRARAIPSPSAARVGTADDTLISASGPRRRSDGNAAAAGRVVAVEIASPGFREAMGGGANIGVVIAGDHRDPVGRCRRSPATPATARIRLRARG